jgi:Phytanoyl-CoA dioxygenase (PhyH)
MHGTDKNETMTETYPCRMVTPDEVAHYAEFGWVQLKRFIDPAMIALVLAKAKGIMGEDGDSNPPYGIDQPYFNAQAAGGLADPEMRKLIEKIGRNAKLLMNRKADIGVRYFTDFFAPKLPSAKKTRNQGNGPTSFHQDFITFAVDRSGGMTFWIPLEAYGPEAGTMSFLNKSHKRGVLGNYTSYGGKDIRDVYPELRDCEESDQIVYELGDITVHSHLTVHGASKNLLDRPRWAYLVLPQPADAVWNGAPPEAFDTTGMKAYQPFDDARFPIIAD